MYANEDQLLSHSAPCTTHSIGNKSTTCIYLYSRNGLSSLVVSASLCGARLHGLILALSANHE